CVAQPGAGNPMGIYPIDPRHASADGGTHVSADSGGTRQGNAGTGEIGRTVGSADCVHGGSEIMDHMPGVFDAVKHAYRDLRDVYEHPANLAIMALGLSLAVTAIGFFLALFGFTLLALLARLVAQIAVGFVMAPYLIAVHRFILLGEVTPRYDLVPGDPRF